MDMQHCTRPRERYWQRGDLHAFLLSSHFSIDWNLKIVTLCAHFSVLSFPFSSRLNAEIEEPRRERSGKGKGKGNEEE